MISATKTLSTFMAEQYFFYREKGDLKRIDINDIILFESDKNYVHFLKESEIIIVRITFEKALKLLSPFHFIQVNRAKASLILSFCFLSMETRMVSGAALCCSSRICSSRRACLAISTAEWEFVMRLAPPSLVGPPSKTPTCTNVSP